MADMSTLGLGGRIRRFRRQKGYESIEAFAQALGYSWITVSRYERGVSTPSLDRLREIADLLEIPLQDLIDDQRSAA